MQPILLQDVVALARCLLCVDANSRSKFAREIAANAHAADQYRHCFGTAHPLFGDGTVLSCCSGFAKGPERALNNAEYARCFATALNAVLDPFAEFPPKKPERFEK